MRGYAAGRQSVWREMSVEECREAFGSMAESKEFKQGRRDAQAEESLDQDTEWD